MKNYEERAASIRQKVRREEARQKKGITLEGGSMNIGLGKLPNVSSLWLRVPVLLVIVCVLVVTLAVYLLMPFDTAAPSVAQFADSPYYNVIQKVNELRYTPVTQGKNRLESILKAIDIELIANKGETGGSDRVPNSSPVVDSSLSSQYTEVTDNQVAGIIEADIFKRSSTHVFHLYDWKLSVYSIEAEASRLVSRYDIFNASWADRMQERISFYGLWEMFLSQDCRTLTILGSGVRDFGADGNKVGKDCLLVYSLDVSDPENIVLKNSLAFEGNYLSSRSMDGSLLLTYTYKSNTRPNFEDITTYIPHYGWGEEWEPLAAEDIILPETVSNGSYTVVVKLREEDLELVGVKALLSYNQQLYVSQNGIYLTHVFNQEKDIFGGSTREVMTEITGLSHDLEMLGSITIPGSVRNQYSMDEYEGILRVAVSTTMRTVYDYRELISREPVPIRRNASLYCIDLSTWALAGQVEHFAPEGEEVTSARFDGTKAYICTAEVIVLSDPVFFFDLSDPAHITWTDTGTIDGFSSNLIQLGDGKLLGIGVNERRELKIELYAQGQDQVTCLDSFELGCDFSTEYKSYFINREKGLFGLRVYSWEEDMHGYLLLEVKGDTLELKLMQPLAEWRGLTVCRAFLDGEFFYILEDTIYPVKL